MSSVGGLRVSCEVCGNSNTELVGSKLGKWRQRPYRLRCCPACHFSFVEDPDTDFASIYDEDYYAGRGADPYIDYEFEWFNQTTTVRQYEYRGVARIVGQLTSLNPETQWLDFGCGNGGLVSWVQKNAGCRAFGYDSGHIAETARIRGVNVISESELTEFNGKFDVITAIEMLEHIIDPVETLTLIHRLLKPNGVFFYTTGNAKPHREHLLNWPYVCPEIHVSFYEPETMPLALRKVGFETTQHPFSRGFTEIIKYKVLKTLRLKRRNALVDLLPWGILARLVDHRHGVSAFPIGIKSAEA